MCQTHQILKSAVATTYEFEAAAVASELTNRIENAIKG
jgi:hypothetical protein